MSDLEAPGPPDLEPQAPSDREPSEPSAPPTSAPGLRVAGALVATGAVMLFVGLMAGPTPGAGAEQALTDIYGFRGLYVATNAADLVALVLLTGGLVLLARACGGPGQNLAVLAEAAFLPASALLAIVLVSQTVVDPALAARYAEGAARAISGDAYTRGVAETAALLESARVVLDFERGLFGLALAVYMTGVACLALGLRNSPEVHLNRYLLYLGAALAAVAALTGIGTLFEVDPRIGQLEALASLATLPWLAVLGYAVARSAVD